MQLGVERLGAGEIVAKRLLDDDAAKGGHLTDAHGHEAARRELLHRPAEELGLEREVEQAPCLCAARQCVEARLERVHGGRIRDVPRLVADARREGVERRVQIGRQDRPDLGAEVLVRQRPPRNADDLEAVARATRHRQPRERRHQLLEGQVSAGPEDDDLGGYGHGAQHTLEPRSRLGASIMVAGGSAIAGRPGTLTASPSGASASSEAQRRSRCPRDARVGPR